MTETPLETFRRAGSATVHEAYGRKGDVSPAIRAICPGLAVAGPALTAICARGDNLAIHRAIAEAEPGGGQVLVAIGHGEACGYLGDILAEAALQRGLAGVVIDGCCRDAAELRRMGFPVWSRGLAIRGAAKTAPGTLGQTVQFGGCPVSPGDLVVADDDGICIVPRAEIDSVLAGTRARLAQEQSLRRDLATGALTLDLLDLRKYL